MKKVKVKTIKCLSIEDENGKVAIRRALVGDKISIALHNGDMREGIIKSITDEYVTLQYLAFTDTFKIKINDIQFYTFLR